MKRSRITINKKSNIISCQFNQIPRLARICNLPLPTNYKTKHFDEHNKNKHKMGSKHLTPPHSPSIFPLFPYTLGNNS